MANPASPVIEGLEPYEIIFGEHQEGVTPLATLRGASGTNISRWELNESERQQVADGASLFIIQHTYFQPPMPIGLQVAFPSNVDLDVTKKHHGLDVELDARIQSGEISKPQEMLELSTQLLIDQQPKPYLSMDDEFMAKDVAITKYAERSKAMSDITFEDYLIAENLRLRMLTRTLLKTV